MNESYCKQISIHNKIGTRQKSANYITFNGSASKRDTSITILLSNKTFNFSAKTFKYPRSVFECSHKITDVPLWTASRTSWWDISPVIQRSAAQPANTLDPEPAQTPMELIFESVTTNKTVEKHCGQNIQKRQNGQNWRNTEWKELLIS